MSWFDLLGKGDVDEIIRTLQQCDGSRVVDLTGTMLAMEHVTTLAGVLEHASCPPFALILRDARLPTLRPILDAAKAHSALTELDLHKTRIVKYGGEDCWLTADHIRQIAALLREPSSRLCVLDLGGQPLSSTEYLQDPEKVLMPLQVTSDLLCAVRSSSALRSLRLEDCRLHGDELAAIVGILVVDNVRFRTPTKLAELDLAGNLFDGKEVINFLNSACHHPFPFVKLNLSGAPLAEGVHAAALRLLKAHGTLCELLPYSSMDSNQRKDDPSWAEVVKQLDANRNLRMMRSQLAEIVLCSSVHLPAELYALIGKDIIDLSVHKAVNAQGSDAEAPDVGKSSAKPAQRPDMEAHRALQRAQIGLLKEQNNKTA